MLAKSETKNRTIEDLSPTGPAAPNRTRGGAVPRRLAELFAPCFTLIVQLRETDAYGEPEALRQRIKDLLSSVEQEARQAGAAPDTIKEAQFAVVAFTDEAVLSSEWPSRDYWMAKPLQLELFKRFDAGEEFFVRLRRLQEQPSLHAELLEVYYLCLALGFKGQHMLHDQGRLPTLISETAQALEQALGSRGGTLSPRGTPHGQVVQEMRRKLPAWVIVVAAAVIGMAVYLGMYVYVSNASDEAARQIEEVAGEVEQAPGRVR